jgi:hypothetical protein
VLPSLVPLQNPLLGIGSNHTMLLHTGISIFLVAFGTILLTLGAAATPRDLYSELSACRVAVLVAGLYVPVVYLLAS